MFDHTAVFEKLKDTNVHLHTDLIAGLPYETYGSFLSSLDKAYLLGGDVLQLGFLKVLHGTPISERKDFGIVTTNRTPYEILENKWISYEEILKLKKAEEILELLYNSGLMRYSFDFAVKNIFESSVSKLLEYLSERGGETEFFDLPKKPRELFEFFSESVRKTADGTLFGRFSEYLAFDYFAAELYTGTEKFLKIRPDFEKAKILLRFPEEIAEKLDKNTKEEFLSTEAKKWFRKLKTAEFDFGNGKKNLVFLYASETVIFEIEETLEEKIREYGEKR